MAITISVAQLKGGEGKTTTTGAIGAALVQSGKRVLMVDADPQTNLTHGLGFEDTVGATLYEALHGQADLASIILEKNGYELVPASLSLSGAEMELSTRIGRERLLEGLIKPLKAKYDFIIIDCPPSIGLLTLNALAASEYVLVAYAGRKTQPEGIERDQ